MELINSLMNLDKTLGNIIDVYQGLTVFLIVFVFFLESMAIFAPFLPGESLFFMVGTFCSDNHLNIYMIFPLLIVFITLGDIISYHFGVYSERKLVKKNTSKIFSQENFERLHNFSDKYGKYTLILGKLIPLFRAFIPLFAGMSEYKFKDFLVYNTLGNILRTSIYLMSGFLFGKIPYVKENFFYVVGMVAVVSMTPAIIAYIKTRKSFK